MYLSQISSRDGVAVVARNGALARIVQVAVSSLALAREAADNGQTLAGVIAACGHAEAVDLKATAAQGLLTHPISDVYRQPGDLHVHMFGTAILSFADGITTQAGDSFEIEAAAFGLPLINPLTVVANRGAASVRPH